MSEFKAKIVLDSIANSGVRLTTVELTYPRFIHAEILTHRDRCRNSASSRAIPWPKMMQRIVDTPVIPVQFGAEQRGMQTGAEIDNRNEAIKVWLEARDNAVKAAKELAELGVHKSICNRITEPWMWITTIMTATEWANLFRQRCHPDAEIHFQTIANLLREEIEKSTPEKKVSGEWHCPYIQPDEWEMNLDTLKKISVARCARVSYLTHDGIRDYRKDLQLFDRLCEGSGFGHWSPFEHIATPSKDANTRSGPFRGWRQYRKEFSNENVEG